MLSARRGLVCGTLKRTGVPSNLVSQVRQRDDDARRAQGLGHRTNCVPVHSVSLRRPLCRLCCQARRCHSTSAGLWSGSLSRRLPCASRSCPGTTLYPCRPSADHRILCSPEGDCEASWREPHPTVGSLSEPGGTTGSAPPLIRSPVLPSLLSHAQRGLEHGPLRHDARLEEAPECDQELAGQGHDPDPP